MSLSQVQMYTRLCFFKHFRTPDTIVRNNQTKKERLVGEATPIATDLKHTCQRFPGDNKSTLGTLSTLFYLEQKQAHFETITFDLMSKK